MPSLYFSQFMVQEKPNQDVILSAEQILLAASFSFQVTLRQLNTYHNEASDHLEFSSFQNTELIVLLL